MTEHTLEHAVSSDTFAEAQVTVHGSLGLHARPAGRLAMAAQPYCCSISLAKDSLCVDCKSILDILTLSATKGTTLTLRCEGQDAQEACEALTSLFREGLEEYRG